MHSREARPGLIRDLQIAVNDLKKMLAPLQFTWQSLKLLKWQSVGDTGRWMRQVLQSLGPTELGALRARLAGSVWLSQRGTAGHSAC